jgi:hypothetical protein
MEANRKSTRGSVRRDQKDGNQSSPRRGKVVHGCQQEDHQNKGEEGDQKGGNQS